MFLAVAAAERLQIQGSTALLVSVAASRRVMFASQSDAFYYLLGIKTAQYVHVVVA